MKVLVMSDSHGRDSNVMEALEREMPFDVLIHLGDTQEDEEEFCMCVAGEDIPVYLVSGNCDLFADYPPARIVTLAGHRLLLAHGHTHYVNYGTQELAADAKGNRCEIALYGHTHRPEIDESDPELMILNPGSISYPRQSPRRRTYMILTLEPEKRPEVELRQL